MLESFEIEVKSEIFKPVFIALRKKFDILINDWKNLHILYIFFLN